ncbi:MAG: BNR-4 repeat-containing protein [Bacteroidales bacterium]|jgi:hypothetical protein|nr:BNR-4 repeat-containing protein [Bacteroidales bacterium]
MFKYVVLSISLISSLLFAQTNVTETYISNASFDIDCNYSAANSANVIIATTNISASNSKEVSGWTRPVIAEWLAAGSFEYGFQGALNAQSVPHMAPDGTSTGNGSLGLSVGWGVELAYTQDVTLPAGAYTICYDVYNSYASSQAGTSVVGWVPEVGTSVLSSLNNFPSLEWTPDSVSFTLASATSGKIQVGIKSDGSSSAVLPRVFFDGVKLLSSSVGSVATLGELSSDVGTLNPAFAQDVYDYTLSVPGGIEQINISAISSVDGANVEGAGWCALSNGSVVKTIAVTSLDGETTQKYTVTVFQNYATSWDGNGATGTGSEPHNFNWSCTPSTDAWSQANVFGIRYQDDVSFTYGASSLTGRVLYLRWDGTGGVTTGSTYNYALELDACKTYKLSAKIAWHSNGSSPTYTFDVNSEKDNAGSNLVSHELLVPNAGTLQDVELVFNTQEGGTYYFNIGSSAAVLGAITDVQLSDYTGESFISTSLEELSYDSLQLSHSFLVSAYGLEEDITFMCPDGMTLSPSTISAVEAQCGVNVVANYDDASFLGDGAIQLLSNDIQANIIVKEILPAYMAAGTYKISDDGTWCWFQDPRAVYYEGEMKKTYTGWITSKGKVQVASFNHETGEILTNTISPADFMQVDDHNNPTLLVREDGRLLVAFSGHFYGPMRVIVSENPEDIMSFGPEANFGNNVTYANPYQIGDSTLMFYRDGSSWHPTINTSLDGGITWGTPRELITRNGNQQRPYAKYTQDKSGGIHIIFTTGHPRQEANNHVYYIYFKNNKFYTADGTFVKDLVKDGALNIDNGEAEVIYDASHGKGWTWDIALDANESPVVLYAAFPNDVTHNYYYAYWDGSNWVSKFIVNSGRWFPQTPEGGSEPEPNYSGGMTLNPNDPSVVYLSKQVNDIFEIYKYSTSDRGTTWETEAITANTPEGTINVRPVVPRGHKEGSFEVVWMRGMYITYANYLTAVMYYSPNSLDGDLDSIRVNGVSVSDFDAENVTYTIATIEGGLDNLSIEGYASSPSSTVTVTLPSSLPGSATVEVVSDGAVQNKTYTVHIENATPLDAVKKKRKRVFPNPVNDILNVDLSGYHIFKSLSVYSIKGDKVLFVDDVQCDKIDMNALNNGTYIVEVKSESGSDMFKVVKE